MQNENVITINGRQYDARTGLMLSAPLVQADEQENNAPIASVSRAHTPAHHSAMHTPAMQRSQTLRRRAATKAEPKVEAQPQAPVVSRSFAATPAKTPTKPAQHLHMTSTPNTTQRTKRPMSDVRRSPEITRFAPHPVPAATKPAQTAAPVSHDIGPVSHPAVHKAHQATLHKAAASAPVTVNKPAATIKQEAIDGALSSAVRNHKEHKQPRKKASRWLSIAASSLAVIVLGGYFTYLNMPNLSVRVAAAQAGFDASYPEYKPDGYRLNGPIAAEDGKVSMKFASNAGSSGFSINQEKSTWDSLAVQEYVDEKSGNNAITTTVDGLTVYIYGSRAAWVNGGVLYTIEGSAPLSGEQIRRIATSM